MVKLEYPKSIRELRKFIGSVMYITHFASDLAHYLRPFFRMLKKGNKLDDTPNLRLLFEKLKPHLASAPHLHIFNPDLKIVVRTDSSLNAWLFALFNETEDGTRLPGMYLGPVFPDSQKNLCTFRKEMLALIYGLRRVEYFLACKSFVVETDNQILAWLYRAKNLTAQSAQCMEFLKRFKIEFSVT